METTRNAKMQECKSVAHRAPAHVAPVRRTPEQDGCRMPLRSSTASNLYFAGDGRDLPYNLSEVSLASAMEVADAVGVAAAGRRAAEPIAAA